MNYYSNCGTYSMFLGRTFKANINDYNPDGRGRDTYIAYNNAGKWKNHWNNYTEKQLFEIPKFWLNSAINGFTFN